MLKFDLLRIAQAGVAVDFLFEDAKVVSHHDDLVEKGFQRHLLGLQRRIAGTQDHHAFFPAAGQLLDQSIVAFQAHFFDDGAGSFGDERAEGHGHAAELGQRFSRFKLGLFGGHGAQAGVEADVGEVFGNALDGADTQIGMPHLHTDMHGLKSHERLA